MAESGNETRQTEEVPPNGETGNGAGEKEMTFLDHLEEFRFTALYSLASFVVGVLLIAIFIKPLAGLASWPMDWALGERSDSVLAGLTTRGPFEVFGVILQLCFFGGLGLSLPAVLFLVARFIMPGLTAKERTILVPACLATFGLFLAGSSFAFFLLTPATLRMSLMLNDWLGFATLWGPAAYYGLVVTLTTAIGLAFQFPLVVIILIHLEIVSVRQLRLWRRFAVVFALIFSAIITPTVDPVTFLFLATPLYFLYELSIMVGVQLEKRRQRSEAEAGV